MVTRWCSIRCEGRMSRAISARPATTTAITSRGSGTPRARRPCSAALLLLALVPQACQRDEVSAPRRALEADAAHSRAPDELTFTVQPPEAIEASAVIAPAVQVSVTDASGAPVPGSVVRLELGTSPTPGATLSGTTQVKLVDGVATFDRLTFAALSIGAANHTCGVTTSRAAYCWGHNAAGEIGDGTRTNRSSPVLVGGGLSFVALSTGGETTCGVTTTGAAYCWGDNQLGQVGDGTSQNQRASPLLLTGRRDFAALAVSYLHAFGVAAYVLVYSCETN